MKYGKVVFDVKKFLGNMTQLEFSEISGINKNTISQIARNKSKGVYLDILARICHISGKSPGDILRYIPEDPGRYDIKNTIKMFIGQVSSDLLERIVKDKYSLSDEDFLCIADEALLEMAISPEKINEYLAQTKKRIPALSVKLQSDK